MQYYFVNSLHYLKNCIIRQAEIYIDNRSPLCFFEIHEITLYDVCNLAYLDNHKPTSYS